MKRMAASPATLAVLTALLLSSPTQAASVRGRDSQENDVYFATEPESYDNDGSLQYIQAGSMIPLFERNTYTPALVQGYIQGISTLSLKEHMLERMPETDYERVLSQCPTIRASVTVTATETKSHSASSSSASATPADGIQRIETDMLSFEDCRPQINAHIRFRFLEAFEESAALLDSRYVTIKANVALVNLLGGNLSVCPGIPVRQVATAQGAKAYRLVGDYIATLTDPRDRPLDVREAKGSIQLGGLYHIAQVRNKPADSQPLDAPLTDSLPGSQNVRLAKERRQIQEENEGDSDVQNTNQGEAENPASAESTTSPLNVASPTTESPTAGASKALISEPASLQSSAGVEVGHSVVPKQEEAGKQADVSVSTFSTALKSVQESVKPKSTTEMEEQGNLVVAETFDTLPALQDDKILSVPTSGVFPTASAVTTAATKSTVREAAVKPQGLRGISASSMSVDTENKLGKTPSAPLSSLDGPTEEGDSRIIESLRVDEGVAAHTGEASNAGTVDQSETLEGQQSQNDLQQALVMRFLETSTGVATTTKQHMLVSAFLCGLLSLLTLLPVMN